MFSIDQLNKNNSVFNEVEKRFSEFFDNFVKYSDRRSILSGKVAKSSNKANSYKNHLIRLIIDYEKRNDEILNNLDSFDTFKKLNSIRNINGFKKFNTKTHNFYSASLAEYERYLREIQDNINMEIDKQIDDEIFKKEVNIIQADKSKLLKTESPKKKMIKYKSHYIYPRNVNEAIYAKEKANWKCEVNLTHTTFKTKSSKYYVETHHLIPLSFQYLYTNTIDFAGNLVALCPTCHRLLHHATVEEKKKILLKLFEDRKKIYLKYGIEISFTQLLRYYT